MKSKLLLLLILSTSALGETRPEEISLQPKENTTVLSISFNFDIRYLSTSGISALKNVDALTKINSDFIIVLTGHTDDVGDERYNHKLGLERAQSVAVFLEDEFGISLNKMVVRSRGEMDPIASNQTQKGRDLNRRVDIYIP